MTDDQRRANLERGTRTKMARAQLKRDLKAGRIDLRAAMERPEARGMRVWALLLAVPRVGRVRATRTLTYLGVVSHDRRVGELTARQKAALREELA